MVFGLLAIEVPAERRSATLNLVYLPLYAAGIVGPALGAIVVSVGLRAPFWLGAAVYLVGARGRRPAQPASRRVRADRLTTRVGRTGEPLGRRTGPGASGRQVALGAARCSACRAG